LSTSATAFKFIEELSTNVEGWSVGSFDGVHGVLWSRSNRIVRMMRIRMHRDAIRIVILRPVFGLPAIMVW
jgi:hypothetical protein